MKAKEAFDRFASQCPHRICLDTPRRTANALNIEHFIVFPYRCKLKIPSEWKCMKNHPSAARWLLSGGEATVFGPCLMGDCAIGQEWCPECGHRRESHFDDSPCRVTDDGTQFPCGCEYYIKNKSE